MFKADWVMIIFAVALLACNIGFGISALEYMKKDDPAYPGNPGDDIGQTYIAGNVGAQWTPEEVESTRSRILQLIHPDWKMKYEMGINRDLLGNGGCDGCLNWEGMYNEIPSANKKGPPPKPDHRYKFDPINATNNQILDSAAEHLELIYKTIDWPFTTPVDPNLKVSLYQSGKSRADLWQFAGLVALEKTLERSNRACDLDYHARQQVTLLESREKCEIKLTKPLKFLTGRRDCIKVPHPTDAKNDTFLGFIGKDFITYKKENQPKLFGDGKHLVDYGKDVMNVDVDKWMALQAIHGAVHVGNIGLKYTWFGPGYVSNVYFKMIANYKTYKHIVGGGDLSLTTCVSGTPGVSLNVQNIAYGDSEGNPINQTGWRTSCEYVWNSDASGPCVLRPIKPDCYDSPASDKLACGPTSTNWTGIIDANGKLDHGKCKKSKKCGDCNDKNIAIGGNTPNNNFKPPPQYELDYSEDHVDSKEEKNFKKKIHSCSWENNFGFPWELGMYWDVKVKGDSEISYCEGGGGDEDFGTIADPKWPFRNNNNPIYGSSALITKPENTKCKPNPYDMDGKIKPLHEIVDELASDNEVFAEKFLEGWQQMTSNGNEDLRDGPENGWFGYYSLAQQPKVKRRMKRLIRKYGSFEDYIAKHKPVTFTDPNADPFICGHRGHATTPCAIRFSKYMEIAAKPSQLEDNIGGKATGCNLRCDKNWPEKNPCPMY